MAEPQLCVKRQVYKQTHLVCTRSGQTNVSEIDILFIFALYLCSLLCHLLHEVRGAWRKQALVLKSSLEHVIYTFVSITKLLVLVLYGFVFNTKRDMILEKH